MAWEDAFWDIHKEIADLKLKKQFDAQLEKMSHQDKHKYKDTRDRWTYAHNKVVNANTSKNKE